MSDWEPISDTAAPTISCRACNGRGDSMVECPVCGGDGRIANPLITQWREVYEAWVWTRGQLELERERLLRR